MTESTLATVHLILIDETKKGNRFPWKFRLEMRHQDNDQRISSVPCRRFLGIRLLLREFVIWTFILCLLGLEGEIIFCMYHRITTWRLVYPKLVKTVKVRWRNLRRLLECWWKQTAPFSIVNVGPRIKGEPSFLVYYSPSLVAYKTSALKRYSRVSYHSKVNFCFSGYSVLFNWI